MKNKRGRMGFSPENPNKIDDISKMNGFKLTPEDIKAYKKARTNALAKARRLKSSNNREAWIALGGLEIEEAQKEGRRTDSNLVHPYLDTKNRLPSNPSKLLDKKELFENYRLLQSVKKCDKKE